MAKALEKKSKEYEGCFGWGLVAYPGAPEEYCMYEHSVLRRKADGQLVDPTPRIAGDEPCSFLPDPLLNFATRDTLVANTTMAMHVYEDLPVNKMLMQGTLRSTAILPFGSDVVSLIGKGNARSAKSGCLRTMIRENEVARCTQPAFSSPEPLAMPERHKKPSRRVPSRTPPDPADGGLADATYARRPHCTIWR